MAKTVAETIRDLTREHLEKNNGLLMGQCITAVGWIQNTVPPHCVNLVELPMNDNSGPGMAVGAAIAGRRPILVFRFQSFLWMAASPLVNHAAKAKAIFGYPAPVFIRAIATEGGSSGPVHTNCYHSIYMHMPGMPVCAPMTPKEYEQVWDYYMKHDDPILVSEHRRCYLNSEEMPDIIMDGAEITLYAASAGRLNALEAHKMLLEQGVKANLIHLVWLKPFEMNARVMEPLRQTRCALVIDSTYEIVSACEHLAYTLMINTGFPVQALGQFDRTQGLVPRLENGTPVPERIVATAKEMVGMKKLWGKKSA